MSFCKFSPGQRKSNSTMIDNTFIIKYLPYAPEHCIKVYLLGLSKCYSQEEEDNNITYFSRLLNLSEEDVISCFLYWQSLGLVQVLSTNPVEVRFLPLQSASTIIKKFKESEFADFNIQAQELFGKRHLMPNEFEKFYDLIKNRHMEQSALITLIKYCVDTRGFNLQPSYVIAVATDWAKDGILTTQQVEEHITELGLVDQNLTELLSAMGSKRKITLEDKTLLAKWQSAFGFELNTIIYVAKMLKTKKVSVNLNLLDTVLTKYYQNRLISVAEIENYEKQKAELYQTAVAVNKQLGLYYEDLSKVIETYILPWSNLGFDASTLVLVADNCFKSSIRTLEGLNNILLKLHKLGIVSSSAYHQYLADNLAHDNVIKEVLTALKLDRNVINQDREYYSVWTNNWLLPHDLILYGASLSANKTNSLNYLNKVLSNWQEAGIKTLEKAQANPANLALPKAEEKLIHNNYTAQQISSLITNLDEVEV